MSDTNFIGNISTIATWISILIYPLIVQYGIEVDQETITTLTYTLIVIIIAIWSSANPNSFNFLKNNVQKCNCSYETEETVMNDEYITTDEDDGGC